MGTKILLTVQDLLIATQGTLYGQAHDSDAVYTRGFSSVVIDSRNVQENSLFIPLMGIQQDGHLYVESAIKNGASIVFVQASSLVQYKGVYDAVTGKGAVLIIVKNTLHALQSAAAFYVKKFPNLKRIAITGSNGKTTVKECIGAVLSQKYSVIMNEGNLNSETGLPLSIFTIRDEHEIGLFEMGMNRRGEITELANVFFPEIALITNIGTSHIGILGTKDAIAEEKKQIFSNFLDTSCGFVFEEEKYLAFLQKNVRGHLSTYGKKSCNAIQSIESNGLLGSTIYYKDETIHFPLVGKHNVDNACAAICIGDLLDLSAKEIKAGLESVKPLFGRSQVLDGNPIIIQDCYNGSFESMIASLDLLEEVDCKGKKIVVLGDMREVGNKASELHTAIIDKCLEKNIDICIFVGESFFDALSIKKMDTKKVIYSSKEIDDNALEGLFSCVKGYFNLEDIVLVKGARGIQLERFVALLQKDRGSV